MVAKRIMREKHIKRGSDAFQGYGLTVYTPIDTVLKDNQATSGIVILILFNCL